MSASNLTCFAPPSNTWYCSCRWCVYSIFLFELWNHGRGKLIGCEEFLSFQSLQKSFACILLSNCSSPQETRWNTRKSIALG